MEKRGLIIKQFRGNECVIAISGWQFPRWKEKKKKRRAAFQLLAPFPLVPIIGPRNRVSENSFFRVEESGAIVEFLQRLICQAKIKRRKIYRDNKSGL